MIRTLIPALLLCASTAAGAQPSTYRAVGTEPFWSVTVEWGSMIYQDAERRRVVVPARRSHVTATGARYGRGRLVMDVTRRTCSDGMSDRRYADTIRVRVDGRSLSGCGGAILPPATLAGTSWRIIYLFGDDVSARDRYTLAFTGDRISGQAGCNRFGGSYRVSSDGLQAGPLATTRMACIQPRVTHESQMLRLLRGRVRLFYPDGDTLVMRGDGGEVRLRRVV